MMGRLAIAIWLALLVGCGEPPMQRSVTGPVKPGVSRTAEIGAALARAAKFLEEQQSADGAWRSEVYAPFRSGDALTPIVLVALQSLPPTEQPRQSIQHGLDFLQGFVGEDRSIQPPQAGIAYPVYMAAGAIMAIGDRSDEASAKARAAWLTYLRERQLTEQNGWQPEDEFYGGWSYAPDLPGKPVEGSPLNPLAEPNVSATVFALEALHAAGVESSAEEFRKARQFVARCQNFAAEGAEPTEFDDGGFFFLQSDGVRNKAGVAGRDEQGRERFASYGSATVDGLRALLLCDEGPDSPRVQAAYQWLTRNFSAQHQPGQFAVEAARDSVYFYYCRGLSLLLDEDATIASTTVDRSGWARQFAAELMMRQRADGSWVNTDVEVREDDPLVATSLATAALAVCNRILDSDHDQATAR